VTLGRERPTVTELRRHLKKSLPGYMVPAAYVMLDAMPLNENGKVDREALAGLGAREYASEGDAAPTTAMEMFVAAVWQEALGLPRVGRHDNFFDLGGHSLLSLRVLARVEERVGSPLSPRELIFQTLEQFAATCEERTRLKAGGERSATAERSA
jgi:Phosphopantetheine attachment site